MLFDVFLVYETKFTVGKWQVVVFTPGKKRGRWGGNSTLGESPEAVSDYDHMGLGAPEKLGVPGRNLSFVFIYDI